MPLVQPDDDVEIAGQAFHVVCRYDDGLALSVQLRQTPGVDVEFNEDFGRALDRALDAKTVTMGKIAMDQSDFHRKYEPSNPAADATGYVKYPNVNQMVEMTDMRDAQRSYEANLNIIGATRRMIQRTLDILKT